MLATFDHSFVLDRKYLFWNCSSSQKSSNIFDNVSNDWRLIDFISYFQRQWRSIFIVASAGAILLYARLQGQMPYFSTADNPTAKEPYLLTRTLTYLYLPVLNAWMLICPAILSFDWGMDSVPRITTITDLRNIWTALFYVSTMLIIRRNIIIIVKQSYQQNSTLKQKPVKDVSEEKSKLCPCSVCHQSFSDLHSASCRSTNNNNNCLNISTSCVCNKVTKKFASTKAYFTAMSANGTFMLCLAFITLPFLPATNVFFCVGFVVAERVLYIPSAGLCLLFGLCASKLWNNRKYRIILATCFVVLILVFSAKTVLRNKDWFDEESLYRSAIPVNPAKGEIPNVFDDYTLRKYKTFRYVN